MLKRLTACFSAALIALPAYAFSDTFLYMAEEDGCMWCARWHAEIGPAYPNTQEGAQAPLVQFDLHGSPPKDVMFQRKVRFSPTFILVAEGQEVGRIEGYPGEDYFWGLLGMLFERADIALDSAN